MSLVGDARIDHLFVDRKIEVSDIEVPDTELVRVASDHLPLIAEIRISPNGLPISFEKSNPRQWYGA